VLDGGRLDGLRRCGNSDGFSSDRSRNVSRQDRVVRLIRLDVRAERGRADDGAKGRRKVVRGSRLSRTVRDVGRRRGQAGAGRLLRSSDTGRSRHGVCAAGDVPGGFSLSVRAGKTAETGAGLLSRALRNSRSRSRVLNVTAQVRGRARSNDTVLGRNGCRVLGDGKLVFVRAGVGPTQVCRRARRHNSILGSRSGVPGGREVLVRTTESGKFVASRIGSLPRNPRSTGNT
jgi:hypothetical protein